MTDRRNYLQANQYFTFFCTNRNSKLTLDAILQLTFYLYSEMI